MTWILTCGWKWLVASLMPLGMFGSVVVAAIALTGAIFVPVWGVSKLAYRFIPKTARAVTAWCYSPPLHPVLVLVLVLVLGFLGMGVVVSPEVVEDLFDCDTCLPESMRDKCEADREAAEARDRAQFLTLCERWNWTECPVILEGDKP